MKKISGILFAVAVMAMLACATVPNNTGAGKSGKPAISNLQILDQPTAGQKFRACFDFQDEDGDLAILEITWIWKGNSESYSVPLIKEQMVGKIQGRYCFKWGISPGNKGNTLDFYVQVVDKKKNKSNTLRKSLDVR